MHDNNLLIATMSTNHVGRHPLLSLLLGVLFVLAKYFGFGSIMTYLLALSVAIGGMIWAALYKRCGSLITAG